MLLGSAFVVWTSSHRNQNLNDDVLITLTYAKNIALGRGFVFNHAPATLGTTSPLFAITVGFLGKLLHGIDITLIAASLATMCWIATGWLLFLNCRLFQLRNYEACTIALVYFVFTQRFFYVASEYMPFQLLLLVAILLFLQRQMLLCGIAVGLLFLTRGEGGLLLPVLGTTHMFRSGTGIPLWRPSSWRATLHAGWRGVFTLAGGFALVFAAWSAYALPTFGMLLPNTLKAKMIQGEVLAPGTPHFIERLVSDFPYWIQVQGLRAYSMVVYALGAIGLLSLIARRGPLGLVVLWVLPFIVGYTLLRVPGAYNWYQIPVYYAWLLCIGVGLVVVTRRILERSWIPRPLGAVLSATLLMATLTPVSLQSARTSLTENGDPRAGCYKAIAQWMRDNAKPEERLASEEVGYLGYYTDNVIIDLYGLVSPEVLALFKSTERKTIVAMFSPEYYLEVIERPRVVRATPQVLGETRYFPVLNQPMHRSFAPHDVSVVLYRKDLRKKTGPPRASVARPGKA